MKRLHYSAITAALVLLPFLANAKGEEYDIPIRKVIINTRSIIGLPEASIDAQSGQLSVSFDSGGTCALLVEDSLGVPVYTSTLPADGMEYSYDLSGIGEGMFRLVIEGPGGEYEGYFNLL